MREIIAEKMEMELIHRVNYMNYGIGLRGVGNKILKVSVCGCLEKVCQVKTCTSIQ